MTGVLDQSLAWLGEIGAFAKPLEKRNSKPLLELLCLRVIGLCELVHTS